VPHLLARLSHPDLELRAKAAEALGEIGADSALPALRALFDDETQELDVRVRAAYALALAARDDAARAWLVEQRDTGRYHAATIDELLSRIPAEPR
ncbi:MAG: HEAT repeat domain-containing protein, partial [Planctomycetes bacterium]|nr:HEAT repeat domain-containing protein [Planctomycetota bacterium]